MEIYAGRRRIIWNEIRDFKTGVALLVATACGAGLFPLAPGTMGTIAAIPLAYFSQNWMWTSRVLLWLVLTILGSWAATVFDETMKTRDNQNIVIDEVIGLGVTSWTAGQNWKAWVAAFFLFRFFDIVKLPPVRQVDAWSKNQSSASFRGFAVIADDIVAGFQALAVMMLLQMMGYL